MLQTVHRFIHAQIHIVHRESMNEVSKVTSDEQTIGQ